MGAWSHKIDGNDTYEDVVYVFDEGVDATPEEFERRVEQIGYDWGTEYKHEAALYICFYAIANGLPITEWLRNFANHELNVMLTDDHLEDWTDPRKRWCYLTSFQHILNLYDVDGEPDVKLDKSKGIMETILGDLE